MNVAQPRNLIPSQPMNMAKATYAFDRQSARTFDADGRMRVKGCIVSVAEVNPYYGREIPGHRALGLDPAAVYAMYRDPVALEQAGPSFEGNPLMIRHVAQTADEPRKEHMAGSVYNVRYEHPHLRADLLVMDKRAIEMIQTGELADLSSSYRYTPDMVPGTVDGVAYDGVMRGIEGNHVALVEDGRATGAHVADSAINSQTEEIDMATIADLTAQLAAMQQRLDAVEGRANDSSHKAEDEEADKLKAEDEEADKLKADDEEADKLKADDEEADKLKADDADAPKAMDAKSVQALIDAARKEERQRAADLDVAKRATRAVLGDMIAMDSAADVYRAALKQKGVDVSIIAPGTEQIAWSAYQAGSAGAAAPIRAADSAGAGKPVFDTSRINVK